MFKLRKWLSDKLILSKRFGILFYITEMRKQNKRINLLRDRIEHATDRGYCSWCSFSITKAQSCYHVCNRCEEFVPMSYIHAKCFHIDDCCGGCKKIDYLRERRRIQ